MIHVIYGSKGSGKTKRILDLANETAKNSNGSVVFIDYDDSHIHDIDRSIRVISAQEYGIVSPKVFTGFILGISAQDFDLENIFVDGFLKIVNHSIFELEDMFKKLESFTNSRNITLTISMSGKDDEYPDYLKKYLL